MKRNHIAPLLLLLIAVLLASSIVISLLRPVGARAETYQYKVEPMIAPSSASEMELQIRKHAEKGWELLAVHSPASHGGQIYMIFKK